ncbi:MAG: DegV family protein [Clostridia bacterium]|nr:DegV family protein [Clostridia bacterium]
MSDFILSCCSTADLSAQKFEEIGVSYICTTFRLNGTTYPDDLGKTITYKEFYKAMADGADTSTSQINQDEFKDYFRELLKSGKDLLHLSLSSGISGTYNSARLAIEEMRQEFPDRKIYHVDSLAASSGYGLFMAKLSELKAQGMSIEELYKWAEDNKNKLHHWFFTTDLTYFVKGGRVSKASGFIGGVLGICPLLNVNDEGKLIAREKIRGKKRVIPRIVEMMKEHAQGGLEYNDRCYICNSACLEDAKMVAELVEEAFPKLTGKVEIYDIGTTIGSHTGPGTVALFFWGDERVR